MAAMVFCRRDAACSSTLLRASSLARKTASSASSCSILKSYVVVLATCLSLAFCSSSTWASSSAVRASALATASMYSAACSLSVATRSSRSSLAAASLASNSETATSCSALESSIWPLSSPICLSYRADISLRAASPSATASCSVAMVRCDSAVASSNLFCELSSFAVADCAELSSSTARRLEAFFASISTLSFAVTTSSLAVVRTIASSNPITSWACAAFRLAIVDCSSDIADSWVSVWRAASSAAAADAATRPSYIAVVSASTIAAARSFSATVSRRSASMASYSDLARAKRFACPRSSSVSCPTLNSRSEHLACSVVSSTRSCDASAAWPASTLVLSSCRMASRSASTAATADVLERTSARSLATSAAWSSTALSASRVWLRSFDCRSRTAFAEASALLS
mmetsp:Transcript_1326/g.4350  ORF Transcript_1326/g.4350 Transcript_1326/m.4350 type:complete len:403 (-) Transcript_1326:3213-4421(-)